MRIMKFGGKSVATHQKMQNICKFIKNIYKNDKKIIIIISAMGNTTDELIAESVEFGGQKPNSHDLANLLSTGETKSCALMSMMLNSMGVNSKSVLGFQINITTFGDQTNSKIAYINKSKIENLMEHDYVLVVAGFQGINSNNEITTLGRGGSDTTASAIGAVFGVDVEIYSDFNGIYAGDPRDLNFKKIKNIDYSTMIELAESGAKVLDARATKISKEFGINIISKGSNNPNACGTIVSEIEKDVISVATISNLCEISVLYSCDERSKLILKNVLFALNNIKYYTLKVQPNKITFVINMSDKLKVISLLARKLNLLKENN